jgi:hypothetical protein
MRLIINIIWYSSAFAKLVSRAGSRIIMAVSVSEMTVHNNFASSSAETDDVQNFQIFPLA